MDAKSSIRVGDLVKIRGECWGMGIGLVIALSRSTAKVLWNGTPDTYRYNRYMRYEIAMYEDWYSKNNLELVYERR